VVQSLPEAVGVLERARTEGVTAILESPPRVCEVQGTAWFLALAKEASQRVPGVLVETLIDAGSAPALAVDALAQGAKTVRLAASPAVLAKLKAIAQDLGARIEPQRKKKT